eukprot:1180719-Amphidinium_carterae.1
MAKTFRWFSDDMPQTRFLYRNLFPVLLPENYICCDYGPNGVSKQDNCASASVLCCRPTWFTRMVSQIVCCELCKSEQHGNKGKDVDFSYFTAGLGGSGAVNLLITNLGFGNPLPRVSNGRYAPEMAAG